MKTAIHEYHKMQRDMDDFITRQRELKGLNTIHEEFRSRLDTYRIQEYIVTRAKAERLLQQQQAAETEMRRLEDAREKLNAESDHWDREAQRLLQRITELEQIITNDPATTRNKELQDRLTHCTEQIQQIESKQNTQLQRLHQQCAAWCRRIDEIA